MRTSAEAFDVVKFAGALYLVYLGIQALRRHEGAAVAGFRTSPFRIGLAWLTVYPLAAARSRAALQRPRVRAALDSIGGIVLVGLGVRLAFERR